MRKAKINTPFPTFNGQLVMPPIKVQNSYGCAPNDPLAGIFGQLGATGQSPLSQPWETLNSNSVYLFTMDRAGLTYTYKTHGIMKKPIDVPVHDAFRGGVIIKSKELDSDNIKLLQDTMRKEGDIHQLKQALKWRALFGGAGLIINVEGDFMSDFSIDDIKQGQPLRFVAADRWELLMTIINPLFQMIQPLQGGMPNPNYPMDPNLTGIYSDDSKIPYNYYGLPINKSRVLRIVGEDAPSMIRPQLQGWGLSKYEAILRNLNQYVKESQVLFKLMDTATLDVLRFSEFNSAIIGGLAKGDVDRRIQLAMYGKNYLNALLMDKEDEYDVHERTFTGLADMKMQIRIDMAAAIGMPMTKLWGMSASGFSNGEDDIEVYNGMVESDVREPAMDMLTLMVPLRCKQLFGFVPVDLMMDFHPLRVLGAVEEEEVKTSKQTRYTGLFSLGLTTGQETMESLQEDEIYVHDSEVLNGAEPTPPMLTNPEERPEPTAKPKVKVKNAR